MKFRGFELVRAGWGAVLLSAPAGCSTTFTGRGGSQVARRHARPRRTAPCPGGVLRLHPSPEVLAAEIWVDTVHSMTAFGLAAVDRRRARGGVIDGLVAGLWAGLALRHLHTGEARTGGPLRGRDRLARTVIGAIPGGRRLMAQAVAVRAGS